MQAWDCELRQGDPVPELTPGNSLIAEQYERRALVTVVAMHVRLFGFPPQQALQPLKSYLRSDFAKALKYLDWRFPDFPAALGEVDLAEWA